MTDNIVSFDIGPFNVIFNAVRYDLKQKNRYSVIAKAIGQSDQTATVSVWLNDPAYPLSTDDKKVILKDTGIMARWAEPSLPSSIIQWNIALPSAAKIAGYDGFYVCINYGMSPEITASCERVFCSLNEEYLLNILSIYPVTSKEKPPLIADIVGSILTADPYYRDRSTLGKYYPLDCADPRRNYF